MLISNKLNAVLNDNSWIRKMYDRAEALRRERPQQKIYDLSIGNPVFEPPAVVHDALIRLLASGRKGMHRYCPNQGYEDARQWVAERYNERSELKITKHEVIMCGGAGGGVNIILNTLLDPGDEVVIFTPYFVEYRHYIRNFGGVVKPVATTPNFRINFSALETAIGKHTRALIINSPNNPTGVIYSRDELDQLGDLLAVKSATYNRPMVLISDEPYTRIAYDGITVPSVLDCYSHSIVASSFSKDLALAGERIGYIVVSPQCDALTRTIEALVSSLRILGFVNAPTLLQQILPEVGDAMVDMGPYQRNRELLYGHLTSLGFSCVKPEGAFYLFPRSLLRDDIRLVEAALKLNLVLVPGITFGCPGHFRISYCFETEFIKETLPLFTRLVEQLRITSEPTMNL